MMIKKACAAHIALALSVGLFAASSANAQTILYVDDDAPPGGNGTSWAAAFQHPQTALDLADASGGQPFAIRVAQGRYVPTRRTIADDPRSASFTLPDNVTLNGGYAGLSGASPDAFDVETFVTVLSADINGDDGSEFTNNGENCYHVIFVDSAGEGSTIVGFAISGGNANVDPTDQPELARHRGGGVLNVQSSPHITQCTFTSNHADIGGCIYNRIHSSPQIDHCKFIGNDGGQGGAIACYDGSSPEISDCQFLRNTCETGIVDYLDSIAGTSPIDCLVSRCLFQDNQSTGVSGCINTNYAQIATIADCTFAGNNAEVGAGALELGPKGNATNCRFIGNSSDFWGGAVIADRDCSFVNCEFIENRCGWLGGAVNSNDGNTFINCIFSRNSADFGGALAVIHGTTLINCSISNNTGGGVNWVVGDAELKIKNCIIWGNSGSELAFVDVGVPPIPGNSGAGSPPTGSVVVKYSNIRGGWTGAGAHNIDLPPMFVQPGCDNFRLAHGSPCSDMGSNNPVSNMATDLDGMQRIQNGLVDMGAYEAGHDALPMTACEDDLGPGEFVHLVPAMGVAIPAGRSSLDVFNLEGPDHAFVRATESPDTPHAGSLGFDSIAANLQVETSIGNGQAFIFVRVPFDEISLNGVDPMAADLVHFESSLNRWTLAAEANVKPSPDHAGSVGDRSAQIGTAIPPLSNDLGDYGVYWNPETLRGFVWANVDHASEFAVGVPLSLCPADCDAPSDGQVNLHDLVSVMAAWGQVSPNAGARDVNRSGAVDMDDLVVVITAWGTCP